MLFPPEKCCLVIHEAFSLLSNRDFSVTYPRAAQLQSGKELAGRGTASGEGVRPEEHFGSAQYYLVSCVYVFMYRK